MLQGDLMFTNASLESDTIDGQRYIPPFRLNTIVYAVPKMSDLEQKMQPQKLVWYGILLTLVTIFKI